MVRHAPAPPPERERGAVDDQARRRIPGLRWWHVIELAPGDDMGYVLQLLRDPLRGLEAVRRVCRGRLLGLRKAPRPIVSFAGWPRAASDVSTARPPLAAVRGHGDERLRLGLRVTRP